MAHYDDYDYFAFWRGREYEDAADKLAVTALLGKTTGNGRVIDIGSGGGRLVPLYAPRFREAVLVDPSMSQLDIARSKFGQDSRIKFLQGELPNIAIPSKSVDVIICVRVFHYIERPRMAFAEMRRMLTPNGYLIVEIPNKVHGKARLRKMFRRGTNGRMHTPDSVNIASSESEIFLNHDPAGVAQALAELGFSILAKRSVSNLRSSLLKRILPLSMLIGMERILQPLLAAVSFGPSMYFLAKLETPIVKVGQ